MRLIRLLKRDLAKEMSTWVNDDLLSREQAIAICKTYGIDYEEVQRGGAGYRVLVTLACVFMGLAVITLLSANWDTLPRGLRMGGLIAVTLLTQAWGIKTYVSGRVSSSIHFFLLGNVLFGASIVLIAQIYHLGEHMPDGVFWWALGSAPAAVLLRSSGLAIFSSAVALIWFYLEYSFGFYPALFPVFVAAALYVLVCGERSAVLFLLTAASIGLWLTVSMSALWADGAPVYVLRAEHAGISVSYFILAYAFSHWLNKQSSVGARDYGALLALWVLRFGLVTLFVMTFNEPWRDLIRSPWAHQTSMWPVVLSQLGLAVWIASQAGRGGRVSALAALFVGVSVATQLTADSSHAVLFQIAANVALVAVGAGLIVNGIKHGTTQYFFLGIASILLLALLRYVDLIGDYVGGAALFVVLGAVLLGAARFWKSQHLPGEH